MLNDNDIRELHVNGFILKRSFFSKDEINALSKACDKDENMQNILMATKIKMVRLLRIHCGTIPKMIFSEHLQDQKK